MAIQWQVRAKRSVQGSAIAEPKSKFAKLVWLLPDIEKALGGGHGYQDCIEELKKVGLEFTYASFKGTLAKARKLSIPERNRILGVEQEAIRCYPEGSELSASPVKNDNLENRSQQPEPNNRTGENNNVAASDVSGVVKNAVQVVKVEKHGDNINAEPDLKEVW